MVAAESSECSRSVGKVSRRYSGGEIDGNETDSGLQNADDNRGEGDVCLGVHGILGQRGDRVKPE